MRLLLLGTGGYHPSETRQTACLMLPEIGVVLDAGTAAFRVADHLKTDTLDIFLSHAHLDHIAGLTYLLNIIRARPELRVTVHGEAPKLAAVHEHLFSQLVFPVEPPFELRPLRDEVRLSGSGRLTHFPLNHPGGVVGYRLDWPDRSLAYVTDTTAAVDARYVDKIRGVDLLVHECFFNDDSTAEADLTGHSCITTVARVAAAAGVGRLALVHINPMADPHHPVDLDAARAVFPQTQLAVDELAVEF